MAKAIGEAGSPQRIVSDAGLDIIGNTADLGGKNLIGVNDATIEGNLTVNGTQTVINTETVEVEDNIIKLNKNVTGAPTLDAGIEVERGTSTDAQFLWNETTDGWEAGIIGALFPLQLITGTLIGDTVSEKTPNAGVTVDGVLLKDGLTDGRDVSVDGTAQDNHIANTSNPHSTTAAQTGALVSVDGVSNAGGNVDLIAGTGIVITPDDALNTITFAISETGDISSVVAGNGLTGGGVSGDVTLDVAAGDGISVTADAVAVDATVLRDSEVGSVVQAYDATLQSLSALGTAADKTAYTTAIDTWAETPLTVFGRSLIDDADNTAARSTLGLVIGTNVEAWSANLDAWSALATSSKQDADAELSALAGLLSAADKLPYFTGLGTAALADFTAAGRSILDDADNTAQRATLGLGSIATQDASNVSISGGSISGITDLAVADGGTGASTAAGARTNLGVPQTSSTTAESNIVVGASPFTYQNTETFPIDVIVNGGTVTSIEFSRDNVTYYSVGITGGMFELSPNDYLKVTYTVAPTMTKVPR